MAETQTPNYKWIKPDIGGDSTVWGNVLNTTIDAIDSTVWANKQAGLPVGSDYDIRRYDVAVKLAVVLGASLS